MRSERSRDVVLLASRGALSGLGPAARSHRLRVRRVEAIRLEPSTTVPPRRADRPPPSFDTVIVTSRHAVGATLRAWVGPPSRAASVEAWAGGPGTAERLRRFGFRRVRQGVGLGASGIARRLGGRRRRIVHVRSDLAGSALARALRARGHAVTEVVAYRVRPNVGELRRRAPELRRASVVLFTSPSTVASLRAALGASRTRALGSDLPAVVLGERTALAAAAAGFRRVSVARTTLPQRLARQLARAAHDARA
jgi:uroporphyrinogen-III synthase